MKKPILLFALLIFLLIVLPAAILAWNMNASAPVMDVTGLIALVGFGIVPDTVPAFLLLMLILWQKSYNLSALAANRPVLLASLGAVFSVYAVHLWTLLDPVQFGLLVHAFAVPFCGVVAIVSGFAAGSFLKKS
jgi:hypothetical protein